MLLLFDDEFVFVVDVLPLVDVLLLLMKSLKSVVEVVVLVLLSYSWSFVDGFSQSKWKIMENKIEFSVEENQVNKTIPFILAGNWICLEFFLNFPGGSQQVDIEFVRRNMFL